MGINITYKHSLYSHSTDLIDEFNEIACRYLDELPAYERIPHNELDHVAAVFNYWINFVVTNQYVSSKVSRLMTQHCNFMLIDIVEKNENFKIFLEEVKQDKDKLFILCYFIASEYLVWIYNLLHEHGEGHFTEVNRNRSYFTLTADEELDEQDIIFYEQRLVTSFMMQDTQVSLRHERHIRKAIYLTKEFLLTI